MCVFQMGLSIWSSRRIYGTCHAPVSVVIIRNNWSLQAQKASSISLWVMTSRHDNCLIDSFSLPSNFRRYQKPFHVNKIRIICYMLMKIFPYVAYVAKIKT